MQGKTALHIAAAEGFTHVLKVVLEYGPDLNSSVSKIAQNSSRWMFVLVLCI